MLCHQHPADSAHAACQRCQRGLCRGCTKQFLQRLCTHCVDAHAQARIRSARRTLWLALPVFALAAWAVAQALHDTALPARGQLYFAVLAGSLALGAWLGLRRWRREPALAGGVAAAPEGKFGARVLTPLAAGIVFWPWLLVEAVRDIQLAGRLRAFVPPEARESSFGFGELSLAVASLAAAFTLGSHGLSNYTPVAGKLWAAEAGMASHVQSAVRSKAGAQLDKVLRPEPGAPSEATAALPEPEPRENEPPSAARLQPARVPDVAPEPPPTVPHEEGARSAHRRRRSRDSVDDAPDAPPDAPASEPSAPVVAPEAPTAEEPVVQEVVPAAPARAVRLNRRFVPGSEMARQQELGTAPAGTYVTSSGRVVMPAPPPPPN